MIYNLNILTEYHNSCCNRYIFTDHICYYLNLVYRIPNSAMDDKYCSVYQIPSREIFGNGTGTLVTAFLKRIVFGHYGFYLLIEII